MKRAEVFFLLFAAAIAVFLHFFYFRETYYDRDVPSYVYNTLDVLNGKGWYCCSTWHPKPPGINLIILAAFNLFGRSFKSIYLAALFFNLLSVFFIYLLAKLILSKETRLYFLLPIFYILFFAAEPFRTYSANTEVFLAPFEIGGMLFLGLNQYLISGVFLGLGFLIRESSALTFIAAVGFIIIHKLLKKTPLKALIKDAFIFIVAFSLPFVITSIYFLSKGVFDKFLNYSFIYNLQHLGECITYFRQKELFHAKILFWKYLKYEIIVFGLLSLIAFFYAIIHRTKPRLLVSVWFIVILFWLLISGIYPHHFTQIIAPIACVSLLGAADIFEYIKRLFKGRTYFRNAFIAALVIILFIPYIRLITPFITKKRPRFPAACGAAYRFDAAKYIKEHTNAKDKIFVWDNFDSGAIFLWSERGNITSFRERYVFLPEQLREYGVPDAGNYRLNQKQLLLELQRNPPKYIVVVFDYKGVIGNLGEIEAKIKDPSFEINAFPEFFQMLNKDYKLEQRFGDSQVDILICRYNDEKN